MYMYGDMLKEVLITPPLTEARSRAKENCKTDVLTYETMTLPANAVLQATTKSLKILLEKLAIFDQLLYNKLVLWS